jgi:hypothetical protein
MKRTSFQMLFLCAAFAALASSAATEGPYTYTVTAGKATISGFDSTYSGSLFITNTLGGYPVTTIGVAAFIMCSGLTSVTIPDGIITIGDNAFDGSSGLTSVSIPASVTTIGCSAFAHCTRITNVTVPNGVTSIADSVFNCCFALTNASLPSSVTSIGSRAFALCDSLASVTLPENVTNIGDYAFSECPRLTSVTLPDSVTTIGAGAFNACIRLPNLTIPGHVTTIGAGAFNWCLSLSRVYFAGSAPATGSSAFSSAPATLYYLPSHASSWPSSYADRPTKLWNPTFTATDFAADAISCTVTGSPPIPIAFETTTNITSGPWLRLATTNLDSESVVLHDPDSTNYPARFYRIVGP